MDGNDRELGWEDVGGSAMAGNMGSIGGAIATSALSNLGGTMAAAGEGGEGGIGDAVTSAMVSHLAREMTKNSLSYWPQFLASARRYFNVTHGYVLRKMLWQLVPLTNTKKKSSGGELDGDKEWTSRVSEGLEVDIEEPDLYIPTMGFVTYVLLCGVIQGLQDKFKPDVLSATINYTLCWCIVETLFCKAAMFTAGVVNAPAVDLATLLGYKYFYLSLQLFAGLVLGWGYTPQGFFYSLISLGLFASCGIALWQALRRCPRMQPSLGQECVNDIHKLAVKAIPVFQGLVIWWLLPHWPGPRPAKQAVAAAATQVVAAAAAAFETTFTTLEPLLENATRL